MPPEEDDREAEEEAEVDRIWAEATEAAHQAWWPGGMPANPYAADDPRAPIWDAAFRQAFIQANH